MTNSSDKHGTARYPLAYPPPPKAPRKPAVPAFPSRPAGPLTPATRAFPPPPEQITVRYGEQVVRDARADIAAPARFDVNLRQPDALPADLVAQVRAEAEAIGYAAGWAQGRREARDSARAEAELSAAQAAEAGARQAQQVEWALVAVANAASQLERRAVPAARDVEDQIVATALELAAAVLDRELRTAIEPGREALARALALAPAQRPVTVRLNPVDRLTMGSSELLVEGRTVILVDDRGLQSGDAVAVCDATTIDARLGPALDRVREVLL